MRASSLGSVMATVVSGMAGRAFRKVSPYVSSVFQEEILKRFIGQATNSSLAANFQPKLNDQDWEEIEIKAMERHDFGHPCAVCQDELGCREHVRCGHSFSQNRSLYPVNIKFQNCIEAFEKFTLRKVCPLCRKIRYETKIVHSGRDFYLNKCAAKIQSTWKMFTARSAYVALRESIPPKDPILRKRYLESKFISIVDKMAESVSMDLDGILEDLDKSIEKSRKVFEAMSTNLNWDGIVLKIMGRGDENCPICLTSMDVKFLISYIQRSNSNGLNGLLEKSKASKPLYILTCSHMFHQSCLNTFETFSSQSICPICRCAYLKKAIEFLF